MTAKRRREFKQTKIEIIPMIDTMFFLLVFFILASLNVIDVKGSQVSLPESTTKDAQSQAKLTITVKRDQEILINKERKIEKGDNVGNALLQAMQGQTDSKTGMPLSPVNAVVVINADRRAPYSLIRRCIEEARMVRFRKFSIATDPKFGVE